MSRIIFHCMVIVMSIAISACDASGNLSSCATGYEGCACADGNRCLTGLECRDGYCIDPTGPRPDAGTLSMDGAMAAPMDAGTVPTDAGPMIEDVGPNPDAFFAEDPPPTICPEEGGMETPTEIPGGTPECPDDKNREGCRCDTPGMTAACWPGLRLNRNRGICRDGVTTCEAYDEFGGRWGPCVGAVLPAEGVERGPSACGCFSSGRWEIDNLSPCFITYGSGSGNVWAVSTYVNADGVAACPDLPTNATPPPTPQSGTTWSANRLTVDCEGRFELCYTLRAGNAETPSDSDCIVAETCTDSIWYAERGVTQELPPLPSWSGTDPACAQRFRDSGGYGEMRVHGRSLECEDIDDGMGGRYVFNRVNYCPIRCNTDPTGEGCERCMMGGSGVF